MHRKTLRLLAVAALTVAGFGSLSAMAAEPWPDRPITWVVPFSPGGGIDLVARIFAKKVGEELHQNIIIENRAGAGGVIGQAHVARSKPDGYTFLVAGNGIVTNSLIRSDQPYRDDELTPVGMLGVVPSVIVTNPSNPANDLKEFVAISKQNGVKAVPFSTAGAGSTPDFVGAMIKQETGLPIQIIPYKSGSEDVTAVIGGQTMATSEASIVTLPLIKAGKLKALATTWTTKLASAPDIKTTAELGYPNIRIGHWEGLFAPTGTATAVLDKMNAAVLQAAKSPDVVAALSNSSTVPGNFTRAEFSKFTKSERVRLAKVVAKGNMRAEN